MRILAYIARFRVHWRGDLSWAAVAVGVGLAIEAFGHGSRNELVDAAGVAVLVAFGAATCIWHRSSPLSAVKHARKQVVSLGAFLKSLFTEFGVDLRGVPPLPQKFPALQLRVVLVLGVLALLVSGGESLIGIRNFLADTLYVGNTLFLCALWILLGLGTFVMLCLFLGMIHDELAMRFRSGDRRRLRGQIVRLSGVAILLLVVGLLLPARLPALLILVATAVSLVWLLPFGPRLMLLWRTRNAAREVYGTRIGALNFLVSVILGLAAVTLVLVAQGGTGTEATMPLTAALGMVFGWSAAAALLTAQVYGLISFLRETREDPARSCPPVLHVSGATSSALRSYIEQGLRHYGWGVRFAPATPESTHVRVVLGSGPGALGPTALRRVSVTELEHPEVIRELAARDVRQKRRLLRKALQNLLAQALDRSYRRGTGFWVNPQHWFAVGITRDSDEHELVSDDGLVLHSHVGQPYRVAIPRAVRNHLFEVLQVLELDLLYLEDGVSFQRFWSVLSCLFKIHDEIGGRVEEHQITGIPGVRTVIHDFALENPLQRDEGFPEPDYEDIGRARILHVFKDLGEHEEPVEIPVERIPRPVSLFGL